MQIQIEEKNMVQQTGLLKETVTRTYMAAGSRKTVVVEVTENDRWMRQEYTNRDVVEGTILSSNDEVWWKVGGKYQVEVADLKDTDLVRSLTEKEKIRTKEQISLSEEIRDVMEKLDNQNSNKKKKWSDGREIVDVEMIDEVRK